MSGSIPQKLRVGPMVVADANMNRKVVELYAASANSQTKYSSGDKLLFNIPSYQKGFIDFSKSYIKFEAKIINSAPTSGKVCFYDNIPIFDRVLIRGGNGVVLEDIQSYQNLERIQMLLKSKTELEAEYINGNYTVPNNKVTDTVLAIKQEKGVGYIKKLHSGLFSNEDYLFPIHRVAGSMELELDIASKASVFRGATSQAINNYADASFEISNVKFVFSLLSVSDEFLSKYNTMGNNNEIVLPITTFQRHVSTFSASEVEPVIFINSAKKDVRRAYTVFNKTLSSIQPVPSAGQFAVQFPVFFKGTDDGDQVCTRFIHKYQDRQYPENHVNATIQSDGSILDQNNLLAHVLTNIPPEKTKMSPYLATLSETASGIKCIYEEQFMIVQDFRSSDDKGVVNALNMNYNSSPLILELKMNQPDTTTTATLVNTYLELSSEIVIAEDGAMSIVTRSANM
jgi:hypothetical protein